VEEEEEEDRGEGVDVLSRGAGGAAAEVDGEDDCVRCDGLCGSPLPECERAGMAGEEAEEARAGAEASSC
jgi:hypothetical protein